MFSRKYPALISLFAAAAAIEGIGAPSTASAFHLPAPCDTITASGTVMKASGGTVSFAATGGCKNGQFWGSLTFTDMETGLQLSSTHITRYLWDPAMPNAREICGVGVRGDGGDSMFRVRLVDNGEPGRNDRFGVATDNRDTAGGSLYPLPPRA